MRTGESLLQELSLARNRTVVRNEISFLLRGSGFYQEKKNACIHTPCI